MSLNKFANNDLVILKGGIYKIIYVNINSNNIFYSLELVAYLESSTGNINTNISKKIETEENELKKFEYSPPSYPIGTRFSGGDEVSLIIFKNDAHKYKYNLSNSNSVIANLSEENLSWR